MGSDYTDLEKDLDKKIAAMKLPSPHEIVMERRQSEIAHVKAEDITDLLSSEERAEHDAKAREIELKYGIKRS